MRFKRHIELEHGLRQIDIAPLIDVVFLLLIFFMLTSSFIMQPGIRINLPRVVTSEVASYENIEIILTADNKIYFGDRLVTAKELKNTFNLVSKRNQAVLIKSDRSVPLGRVVEIWDAARAAGINQVNIATNQE